MSPTNSLGETDAPPGGSTRRRSHSAWAIATLSALTLAFYFGLWIPDQVVIKRDAFRFHLPMKQYLLERMTAGELPQWFPYDGLGSPFIAAAATGLFHPFTALYFLLPAADAYRASALLSCFLAATGAFLLGCRLGYSPAGSLVAGLAFALSGYVASLTENIVYLYSICALPLFCAALEKALMASRAWTVAPAVVWATVFLIGDVQTGYYYGFIGIIWTWGRVPGRRLEGFLRLALTSVLAALLAAVQIGPAAAVFASSSRTQPDLFHAQAVAWSTHPLRLLTVLASPIGGTADPSQVGRYFFGNPNLLGMWAESLYLGLPVTGLALLGAWRRPDLRPFVILGGFALVLALGRYGGLYEVLFHVVPLWSAFRYPEKFMGIVSFSLAMLAGAGSDALREGRGRPHPWFGAAALCGGAWLGLRGEGMSLWTAAQFGAPETLAREVCLSAATAFFFSAIATGGLWLILLARRKAWLRNSQCLAALVAIVTLDLVRANLPAYHTAPSELVTFTPAFAQAMTTRDTAPSLGRFRFISINESRLAAPVALRQSLGHEADNVERRQALALEHNAPFHLEAALTYFPVHSAAFETMFIKKPRVETAARFNVTYFIGHRVRVQDPRFAQGLVAELLDYDLALFRNPIPAKPRAYLSLKPERAASQPDPVTLIARPDFQNGEVDVIETAAATLPGPVASGEVTIEQYAPEKVRIRVDTPREGVLVLLDSYAAGWHATLENGEQIPIMRANALVRAVVVPAGSHAVTFTYRTPLLAAGAWMSALGVAACLAMTVSAHVGRPRRDTPVRG